MKNKQTRLKKRKTLKLLEKSPERIYCEWCTFALLLLMLLMLCTHGELWTHFFFLDGRDTGMDFFPIVSMYFAFSSNSVYFS